MNGRSLSPREAALRTTLHVAVGGRAPTCLPSFSEAQLIGDVRREVGALLGLAVEYVDPDRVLQRYEELLAIAQTKTTPTSPTR